MFVSRFYDTSNHINFSHVLLQTKPNHCIDSGLLELRELMFILMHIFEELRKKASSEVCLTIIFFIIRDKRTFIALAVKLY